ncbi:hypothetical protein [Caproiciproducens galactitolivorans]|uniref:hypothetical protein n=1 Tax=Caproiciproducens galactitolivorans TaxID=642589 RepID=UPI002409DF5E|nr:hypothetical protein [Caproiciproducens galactitolivorans]
MELKERIYAELRILINALEGNQLGLNDFQANLVMHHTCCLALVLDSSLTDVARRRVMMAVRARGTKA